MSPRRIHAAIASLITLAGVLAGAPAASAQMTPAVTVSGGTGAAQAAVRATNTLGVAMLSRLDPSTNAVASPFSVEVALAMVDQGAGSQTADQLDSVLGDVASPAALGTANRALSVALNRAVTGYGAGGPTLNSANGLWVQSGLSLEDRFSDALSSDFGAQAQPTDFSGDPSGAIQSINSWVSAKTHGLIPALVNSSVVNAATSLFLANAVYLHANWTDPFNAADTENDAFSTPTGSVQVPFMHQQASYPYAATSRYTAVALNYSHSSLQYVAIMPPSGQIASLERWLTVSRLTALTTSLRPRALALAMPKFTLSLDTSLNGFLQGLGITDVFSPGGLTNLVSGQPLTVSDVVHDATLKVAERGTVAAAATGVGITTTAAPVPDGLVVELNHPFLVIIRDTRTGAILFAARVLDPSSTS